MRSPIPACAGCWWSEGGINNIKKYKARYIGISNCFAWQIAKANAIAEKEGFAKFVSIQGHYNLIFREEEREMVPYCEEENIALTPYSALASGRLSRLPGEGGTRRAKEEPYVPHPLAGVMAQNKRTDPCTVIHRAGAGI